MRALVSMVRDNRQRGAEPVPPTANSAEPDSEDWGQGAKRHTPSRADSPHALNAHDAALADGREPPALTGSDFQRPGTRRWYPRTTSSHSSPQSRISRPATPHRTTMGPASSPVRLSPPSFFWQLRRPSGGLQPAVDDRLRGLFGRPNADWVAPVNHKMVPLGLYFRLPRGLGDVLKIPSCGLGDVLKIPCMRTG